MLFLWVHRHGSQTTNGFSISKYKRRNNPKVDNMRCPEVTNRKGARKVFCWRLIVTATSRVIQTSDCWDSFHCRNSQHLWIYAYALFIIRRRQSVERIYHIQAGGWTGAALGNEISEWEYEIVQHHQVHGSHKSQHVPKKLIQESTRTWAGNRFF